MHDDVGDVAVDEQLAGHQADDLVGGHAAVRAADPEVAAAPAAAQALEEVRDRSAMRRAAQRRLLSNSSPSSAQLWDPLLRDEGVDRFVARRSVSGAAWIVSSRCRTLPRRGVVARPGGQAGAIRIARAREVRPVGDHRVRQLPILGSQVTPSIVSSMPKTYSISPACRAPTSLALRRCRICGRPGSIGISRSNR